MRIAITALVFLPVLAAAVPDFVADFQPALSLSPPVSPAGAVDNEFNFIQSEAAKEGHVWCLTANLFRVKQSSLTSVIFSFSKKKVYTYRIKA